MMLKSNFTCFVGAYCSYPHTQKRLLNNFEIIQTEINGSLMLLEICDGSELNLEPEKDKMRKFETDLKMT